ncbi:sister chromatid cohesion protein PDS5 homolog E isoform X3 [Leguminivora glycinivorella]|uniref:sister chromatid cohesion protein PDS5 homolog E isoform X3 n=1 Tax=Leguminivora glycinivorella TaxID=1035111 RepID=UPI00200D6B48|nr:sister chromatid cohesion protein PDS5 homolog E isoform X3 [Leguminivora glycinivorella]
MADSKCSQASGGGEGQAQVQPPVPQEAKPAELIQAEQPASASDMPSEVIPESKAVENPSPKAEEPNNENKTEGENKEVTDGNVAPVPVVVETANAPEVKQDDLANGDNSNDWQQREAALLIKIQELEKVKNEKSQDTLRMELKVREEEIDLLKARVKNLETELQAALSKPGPKNHEMIEKIKQQHEELLSKARGMIFDKTKMVKNQELQIEALTTQVQSLKDINMITKDLLEIRNSEIKAMEDRLQAMEERFKTEKERYGLVLQRAQTSSNINDDLKKEYETQLKIFKELRSKYEQKVEALVAENNKLKLDLAKSNGCGTSTETPK